VGLEFELTAKVQPKEAANQKVTYTTSDPTVVSLTTSGGKAQLKAVGEGTAVIRAASAENPQVWVTCEVTVGDLSMASIMGGVATGIWHQILWLLRGIVRLFKMPNTPQTDEQRINKEMQDAVFLLREKDPKYSYESWLIKTEDERKATLEELLEEIQVNITKTNVNRDITWKKADPKKDKYAGMYTGATNTISLYIYPGSGVYYDLMLVLFHELRHGYQYEAVVHPAKHPISEMTLEKWTENQKNYINYDDDETGYFAQPLEWDARYFAKEPHSWYGVQPPANPYYQNWVSNKSEIETWE